MKPIVPQIDTYDENSKGSGGENRLTPGSSQRALARGTTASSCATTRIAIMDRKIRMATPSDVVKGRIKSRVSLPVGARRFCSCSSHMRHQTTDVTKKVTKLNALRLQKRPEKVTSSSIGSRVDSKSTQAQAKEKGRS